MAPSRKKQKQVKERRADVGEDDSSDSSASTSPQAMLPQRHFAQQDGLLMEVLSFLDVTKLVEKKQVSKKWKDLCTQAIDNKCKNPKNFESNDELRKTTKKYCKKDPSEIEEIAKVHGYPINKWKVHLLENFSDVFLDCEDFNEYIGDWDMSNARTLRGMFWGAKAFNQDLSKWDVSKVTRMGRLFAEAHSFNQSLNSWDMSSVTIIETMFYEAVAFNQPLDSWDTSKITDMFCAFYSAKSFDQNLSSWNTESVESYHGMLDGATSFNQELPAGFDADVAFGRT